MRAPAAIARTECHPPFVGQHPRNEVILDDRNLAAAFRPQVHRHGTAALGCLDHDARVTEPTVIETKARDQRVQVELGQLVAVEVQRDMVVVELATVHGRIEADTEAAGEVRLLAKLRGSAATSPDRRVQPRKADAVTLVRHRRDSQIEADFDRLGQYIRVRRGETDRVGTRHIAREQAQETTRVALAFRYAVVHQTNGIQIEAVSPSRRSASGTAQADVARLGQPRTRQVEGTCKARIAVHLVTRESDARCGTGADVDVIDTVQADLDTQQAELGTTRVELIDIEIPATAIEQSVGTEVIDHGATGTQPGVVVIGWAGEYGIRDPGVVVGQRRREIPGTQHDRQQTVAIACRGIWQTGTVEVLVRVLARVRARGVAHAKAQRHQIALVDPSLEQQDVLADIAQRHHGIGNVRGAEHHVAPGIDEPPVRRVTALGQQVEEKTAAGRRRDAICDGLAPTGQCDVGHLVDAKRLGLPQVEQPEAVVA